MKIEENNVPIIDGKLNDPCWRDIQTICLGIDNKSGNLLKNAAEAKLVYNDEFLYIALNCKEPFMDKISDCMKKHDAKVWEENCIDMFFVPSQQHPLDYKHIIINSIGAIYDEKKAGGKISKEWNSETKLSTGRTKNSWTLEMRIPLKKLSPAKIRLGDIWGGNFYRVRNTVKPTEYSAWSASYGPFARPERFGKIIFR